jgi:hypothetical protein
MAKSQPKLLSFNGGVISPLALARQDLPRVAVSAEEQTNWMPRHLGSMMLRPGFGFITPIIPKATNTTLTVNVGGAKTLASSTGLANDATAYTATLVFAGSLTVNISVVGSASQTYATLLSQIYTDMLAAILGGEIITVTLIGGDIVFTVQSRGNVSSLTLADSGANHLFATLTSFVSIGSAVLATDDEESDSKILPFVFSKDDVAQVTLVGSLMRVLIDDNYIDPSPSFSSDAVNGHFLYTLNSWTDTDDSGCTSAFAAGSDGAGYMSLVGTKFNYARRNQQITVSGGDANKEHQCRIAISRGVVDLKIGTSAGDGSYVTATITKGTYYFSFTPTGSFYVEFSSATKYASLVDSIYFHASDLVIETDYTEYYLPLIRQAQSGNVIYLACEGLRPQKIERRAEHSWGLADYLPDDGPFLPYNSTGITLDPSALSGDITLTASKSLFQSGHVGALFSIDSAGQKVTSTLSGENQFSNEIRIAGVTRNFFLTISSIGTNEVTLQKAVGEPSSWTDHDSYTSNQTNLVINDALDNQIIYYRIGIKTGDYTSGSPVVTLDYSEGSISGVCRITAVASVTSASAIVLKEFGGTRATSNWREGAWSDYRGFPSAVCLYEGRLWWGGKQYLDGSSSDLYETFDDTKTGSGRPIRRSIGFGSADNINWMVGSQNLLVATDTRILAARSSFDDAPLTQDDFSLKDISSQGASKVNPVKIDSDVIYVQNSGVRIQHLNWDGAKYIPSDLTALTPEIGEPSITHLAIQQQPDIRIHCVRSDGKSLVLLFDPLEELKAFIPIETDGDIQDIAIFPGDIEDQVYYVVKRDIPDAPFATDASVVRLIEKWALESECQGGTLNKQLDAFTTYSGVSATVFNSSNLSDLAYLEDQEIEVWGNGVYNGSYTVSGAAVTLDTAVTSAVLGLSYTARLKSVKLGRLMDKKIISQVGLIMRNVSPAGIEIGMDFDNMRGIPKADWMQTAGVPDSSLIIEDYHKEAIPIDGTWTIDSRLCLRATAPYPVTVLAAVVNLEGNEK